MGFKINLKNVNFCSLNQQTLCDFRLKVEAEAYKWIVYTCEFHAQFRIKLARFFKKNIFF